MVSLNERTERERIFFDQICESDSPSISSRAWWESPGGKSRLERRINIVKRLLAEYGLSPRVLLVGCGDGIWFQTISQFADLYAVDISPKTVDSLQKRLPTEEKSRIEVGDIHALRFAEGTFDAVIANSTLHHLDLPKGLQEIARVLRDQGSLIAFEPNRRNPQVWFMYRTLDTRTKYGLSADEEAFSKSQIQRELKSFFQFVRVNSFDFWHPVFGSSHNKRFLHSLMLLLERVPIIRSWTGSLAIVARTPSRVNTPTST